MKNIIKKIAVVFILMNLGLLAQMSMVSAADPVNPCTSGDSGMFQVGPQCQLYNVGSKTGLPSFLTGQHKDSPGDYLLEGSGALTSPIYYILDLFRFFISGIAVIVVIIAAIRLISNSTAEEAEKARNSLVYGILGLILVQMADIIVKQMFFGEEGEAFENAATNEIFQENTVLQLRGVVGFMNAFIGVGAVLVIIIRGYTVLASGGNEEALTKAKTHILYAVAGLVIAGISELVLRGFVFPEYGTKMPDIETGKMVLVKLTNYISGFVALAAFLALFVAGYRYVASAGKEEATEVVKKMIVGALIGLILALGAFAIVNTLVKFEEPIDTSEENLPPSR